MRVKSIKKCDIARPDPPALYQANPISGLFINQFSLKFNLSTCQGLGYRAGLLCNFSLLHEYLLIYSRDFGFSIEGNRGNFKTLFQFFNLNTGICVNAPRCVTRLCKPVS